MRSCVGVETVAMAFQVPDKAAIGKLEGDLLGLQSLASHHRLITFTVSRTTTRIPPNALRIISKGDDHMDSYFHLRVAALLIFVCGRRSLPWLGLPETAPGVQLPPSLSRSHAHFQHRHLCLGAQWAVAGKWEAVRGRRDEGRRPRTWSSLPSSPWSSRVTKEEPPTHVQELQCCRLSPMGTHWQFQHPCTDSVAFSS